MSGCLFVCLSVCLFVFVPNSMYVCIVLFIVYVCGVTEECKKCRASVGGSDEKRKVTGLCLESLVFLTEVCYHV